jgi:Zn-dependent M28 family amino/carboxypeptidase
VLKSENVCGLWRGSDTELRREVIVLTAHYDHIGTRGNRIMPGANDNASGTSALMALADALVEHGPLRRSVLLLFVSGGEKGQRGSLAWTKEPTLPVGYRAVCNINLDTIGGNAPTELQVAPTDGHEAHNGLEVLARRLAPKEGFSELSSCDPFWNRSDHFPFHTQLHLPALYLFAGLTGDYHKASDTADRVDCDKVRRVARLVLRIVAELQRDELGL